MKACRPSLEAYESLLQNVYRFALQGCHSCRPCLPFIERSAAQSQLHMLQPPRKASSGESAKQPFQICKPPRYILMQHGHQGNCCPNTCSGLALVRLTSVTFASFCAQSLACQVLNCWKHHYSENLNMRAEASASWLLVVITSSTPARHVLKRFLSPIVAIQ